MKQFKNSLLAMLLLVSGMAVSQDNNGLDLTKGMTQVGQTARMTYLFWDVYDISLYSPSGSYNSLAPFVLQLTYLRDLDGEEIAKRSLEEMQKQGFDDEALGAKWLLQMKQIFPDVTENYSLYGVRDENGVTRFYDSEKLLGEISDQNFTKWFFDIWLSEKTTEPKMRLKLLGEK
ncbi:chalcone isomerase family protein [Pseudoalteromonas luteoviolacea]|uniref:chalcone isomerase family protein n=1 Tax=Pseudoalteromonas luteoviolacea TaxID=43657 RepID=UPI001F45F5FB|nr:chalcone isomerase family protein [Pseudoalteromonas luteoviolacea]MCF6441277.1 chalcone isomerase family protein [Pseudoalteromonas luteoviolacea]